MAIDKPVLWGADGNPLSQEGALLSPNALNVAQVIQNAGKMYSHTWDEAMRDAPQNALAMRRDPFYRSMLQERTSPTQNLDWEVAVPNEDDPVHRLQRDTLQRAWEELPDKPNLMYSLLDGALWWGRSGQQGMWGQSDSGLTNWLYHEPVHGDSIQHQWDRTPVILVSWQAKQKLERDDPECIISSSTRGAYGLRLYKPEYRKRFILHTHVREASDYYEGEMAGGVHGVGLRSWAYWGDYVRRDILAAMLGFMNSTGMMDLVIINYPDGNVEAEKRAIANAKKISGKLVLICPRDPSKDWPAVEQVPMNTAGVEVVQNLLENYFDRYTRELFVGQNMSNGGGGPGGLEGDGRAELAGDTKFQLCKTDARRLAETLTRDWLVPCRDYNFPGSKVPVTMKPILADPKAKEKAQNISVCVANGIEIEEDEARRALGFSKPREGKKTIGAKPAADPTNPTAPPGDGGAVARPPQPPKPDGGHDLATDFLQRIGRLEDLLMYRLNQPPWPGAVFDEQRHRWVNKDGSDGPQGGRATTAGNGNGQPAPQLGDADRDDIANGIDADVRAWKGEEIPPGLVQRAKDVALTIAAKTYIWATQATHSKAMATLGEVMGAVFDTPADMMKLGYNPSTSSGTSGAGVADPVKANLNDAFGVGVSGHLVASVASKVLVKAAYWVRNRTQKGEQPTALSLVALLYEGDQEPDGFFEWAEFIATVLQRTAKGIGSDAQMPDAATVERNLRALVEERQKAEGDDDLTGYAWDESQVKRDGDGQFAPKNGGEYGPDHPRTRKGRPVPRSAIRLAATSPDDADEIRKRLSVPAEREKFDAAVKAEKRRIGDARRKKRLDLAGKAAAAEGDRIGKMPAAARRLKLDGLAAELSQAANAIRSAHTVKQAKTELKAVKKRIATAAKDVRKAFGEEATRYAGTLGVPDRIAKEIGRGIASAAKYDNVPPLPTDAIEDALGEVNSAWSSGRRRDALKNLTDAFDASLDTSRVAAAVKDWAGDGGYAREILERALELRVDEIDPKRGESAAAYKQRLENDHGFKNLPQPEAGESAKDYSYTPDIENTRSDRSDAVAANWLSGFADHIAKAFGSGRATTSYDWDAGDHPRGQPDNAGQFAPKGGGTKESGDRPKADAGGRATTGNLRDRLNDKDDPINADAGRSGRATTHADKASKRNRPKAVGVAGVVDVARSRRIKKAHKVEQEVAVAVEGANLPDSEPADVVYMPDARGKPITDPAESKRWLAQRAKVLAAHNKRQAGQELTAAERSLAEVAETVLSNPAHFFEVKTLQKARQNRVRMTADALDKKRAWQAKYNVVFSVVIVDERKGSKHSGHRVYVAPATLEKTVSLADCVKVGSIAEVLKHARGGS